MIDRLGSLPGAIPDGGVVEGKSTPPAGNLANAFSEALSDAFNTVEALNDRSEAAQAAYAAGEPVELHNVMIQVEEAHLAVTTLVQVRNKLLSAYDEIMRMGSGG